VVKSVDMHAAIRDLGTLFNEGAVGMLSDGQLLDRFAGRRDAWAFEGIVERYGPLVWGVCRRVLRHHHDAEDAFQATFLVLARRAASVMPREKLGNWLYGVAYQTAMKARATRAKRRVRERPAREITEPEAVPDEHADESLSRLDREVARLPDKYRLPIILCELEGKTHRQAAEQLGWPVGTVSGRLSRARALLTSRLSRPGTPLTVGALGVLLAHDAARAGVPPELIRSTAQAASLSMAGKAATAGMVSARVASLTGEVLKTMLLNKLKLATAMLLVALALAAGGASFAYRAHGTEPASREKDSESPGERSKPAAAVQEVILPPAVQPKFAEAAKEDIPKDPNRLTGVNTKSLSPPAETQQSALQPTQSWHGGYSFTASPTGNVAFAYSPETREVKAVRLNATEGHPIKVTPKIVPRTCVVGLHLEGPKITRLAVFDIEPGKWSPLDLDEPASGIVQPMPLGHGALAYQVGRFFYMYSSKTSAWDRLELPAITQGQPIGVTATELKGGWVGGLRVEGPKITRVAVYNIESGKWSPLELDEPASGVVQPIALGPGAVAYQVGRFFYMYSSKTSTWDRLELQAITQGQPIRVTPTKLKGTWVVGLRVEGPKITRVAVYNIESGKWSPLDLVEPASGVVQPTALGPGAVAYEVGRFVYVYRTKTSTWDRLDVGADDKRDANATEGR
jgi:RNA polymerase sigma factor (sigma-70 family)